LISKEINKAEHEYMNMCPPPIIVLATALIYSLDTLKPGCAGVLTEQFAQGRGN
jgi:hypothetical protein